MQTKVFMDWDDQLALGISILDSQHKRLVRLINKLGLAYQHSGEKIDCHFVHTAHEAIFYLDYHHRTEEKLMILLEYHNFLDHKREHEDFSQEIAARARKLDDRKQLITGQFVDFLDERLCSHIHSSDRSFAEFIIDMKTHGKIEEILARNPVPVSAIPSYQGNFLNCGDNFNYGK